MLIAQSAMAIATPVLQLVPEASLVGEGRLQMMLWDIFDARLYAPHGSYDSEKPFALSLTYLRRIDSEEIVDNSIKELKAQASVDPQTLARWKTELSVIFPDVDKGTTITGVRDAQGLAHFYRGDNLIGQIRDAELSVRFFDIWLGEATSQPVLRKQLLSSR